MRAEIKQRIAQIQRGEVPEGYKKCSVGIRPSEWNCQRLKEICIINPPRTKTESEKTTFLGMSDVDESGHILRQNLIDINQVKEGLTSFEKGDILVAKITPCFENGKGANTKELCTQTGVGSTEFHVLRSKINADFIFYHTLSRTFRRKLEIEMTGSAGQKRVQTDSLANYEIAVPYIQEQQNIAAVLMTQDKIIELKEKLLVEKQHQKKYLMQQLLTGKKRLPGFFEKWDKKPFNDVFVFGSTNTFSREQMSEEDLSVQNIHYGDILTKYGEILNVSEGNVPSLIEEAGAKITSFVMDGDIIIADTAEDITAGKAVEIQGVGERKIAAGLHTMLCKPKKKWFALGWLGYYMNSEYYHRQLIPYITGIKVMSISKGNIVKTHILVPCVEEQAAIVNILSTADHEIRLLRQSIEQEKQKKKALMQLLLTGIVRVYNG